MTKSQKRSDFLLS